MPASAPAPKERPANPRGRAGGSAALREAPAPATRPAPSRRTRRAPATRTRQPGAVRRTAGAVRQIPDSGLVHGLTRGRAWIALLGMLLAGIVAINVVTLSLTASTGEMEQRSTALAQQSSALRADLARQLSNDRVEAAALGLGMERPDAGEYSYRSAGEASVSVAVERATGAVEVAGSSGEGYGDPEAGAVTGTVPE